MKIELSKKELSLLLGCIRFTQSQIERRHFEESFKDDLEEYQELTIEEDESLNDLLNEVAEKINS